MIVINRSLKFSLLLFLFFYFSTHCYGQQLCTGSLGDAVVNLNFGTGQGNGAPVSTGTNYLYNSSGCPNDGFYSIVNNTINNCHPSTWHSIPQDHTEGDTDGYMMLVNASNEPKDFYVQTISGLCPGTTYEFSAFIMNLLKQQPDVNPNLRFNIETVAGIDSLTTGVIDWSTTPTWIKYALQFTTPANVTSVVLRITNKAPGGDGNDLLLDDITFRPCGPIITPRITGTNSPLLNICQGTSNTYPLEAPVQGGNNLEYLWQKKVTNSTNPNAMWEDYSLPGSTTQFTQAVFNNAAPGVYKYRLLTAAQGNIGMAKCRTASDSIIITVNPKPVATTNANTPLCEGEQLTLTATGGTTYSWTGPNGFNSPLQNPPTFISSLASAGTYQVIVTNTEGCSVTKTIEVAVNAKPVSKFATSLPICQSEVISFIDQSTTSTPATITAWLWDFGDGTPPYTIQSPTHTYANPGTFPVTLTVTNNLGCVSNTIPINITVSPKPQIRFADPDACLTDIAQLNAVVDLGIVTSWEWDFGDSSNDVNEKFKQNAKHAYAAGQYNVVLTGTSANNCKTVFSRTIVISGTNPIPSFTVVNALNLCSNQPVVFKNTSVMPSGSIGKVTKIEWIFDYSVNGINTIETLLNPTGNDLFTHHYPILSTDKTYNIKVTAYSGSSCSQTIGPIPILVKGSPEINFNLVPAICKDKVPIDLKTFTAISNGYAQQGNWVFSGQGVSANGIFTPANAIVGNNVINVVFNPSSNCASVSKSQTIMVNPSPTVDAGADFTVLGGGERQIQATSTGGVTYHWTLADGSPATDMDNDGVLNPIVSPKEDVTYKLTVTSADQCETTDLVIVHVLKLPEVPNTFTPNGDGIRDKWTILYLDSYPNATIEVFSRYGSKVLSTSGYVEWDGTYNGTDLPVGTYYYIINPKNGRKAIKGYVAIIR